VTSVVAEATRGRKAEVVFEVTGSPASIPAQVPLLHSLGRLVVLSSPRGSTRFDFHDLCNGPSVSIIGAHNTSHPAHATVHTPWTQHRHAELFFDLVADGKLRMEPLISHRAQFTRAPELYAMLVKDRSSAMGVVLGWTD
jgi:threonine dehydrogenase-like Zn-dependent dehydrogenase